MKRLLLTFMAIIFFVLQGWTQTTLNESFEGGFPPEGWTIQNTRGPSVTWERNTSFYNTGYACAFVNYNYSGSTNYLITPKLTINTTNSQISFWSRMDYFSSSNNQTFFKVLVSTTTNDVSSFDTATVLLALSPSFLGANQITDNFQQWTVDLSAYDGQNIYIAFKQDDDNGNGLCLDDISGPELFVSSCPKPTTLTTSNITTTDAELGWTDANGSLWNIQYMLGSETNWINATNVTGVISNPYTIAELNPSTSYKIRVQRDCNTEQSEWSTPITFFTSCGIISQFPWTDGFENNWASTVFAPGNAIAPNCWININKGCLPIYTWMPPHSWAKSTSYSHSGSANAEIYTDLSQSLNNDWLITPQFRLNGSERLRFWAMNNDETTNQLDEISIWISNQDLIIDTTGMGDTNSLSGFTQIYQTVIPQGNWQEYEVMLNQYTGNRYLAFVRRNTPNDGYSLRLDDIEISEIPNCVRPSAITVSNEQSTSAEIAWTNGTANDNSWRIYYKESSAISWDSVDVNTNPYTLQGLNQNSVYDLRMATNCVSGISEITTNLIHLRTTCGTITDFPWNEGFETEWNPISTAIPPSNDSHPFCWININNGYNQYNSWRQGTYSNLTHSGYGSAIMYGGWTNGSAYTNSDWLISPIIHLTGNKRLNFYTKSDASDYLEDISVYILNVINGDITTASDTANFIRIMGQETQTTSWLFHELALSGYQGDYRIAFVRNSLPGGINLCLDDISVSEMPACPNTYNLTLTGRSSTEIDLNWMQNGNGSGWVIAYGDTTSFNPLTATQTITISNTDTVPYTVTGLTPQTPYSFSVRQNCTDGAWSNIVSVNTPATAATLPYSHNFENVTENGSWTFINGAQTNQWVIGTAADTLGNKGLYISNDQGITNQYTNGYSGISKVYAYRDFEVPEGANELEFSFDWRAQGGDAQSDFLRMYLVPLDAEITAGNIPSNGYELSAQIGNYTGGSGEHWLSQSTIWQHKIMRINTLQFPNLAGRTWRLLVHWRNESYTYTGIQPAAAVDNINLSVVTCPTPTLLTASNPTATSIDLAWQENGQSSNWIIEYKESYSTTWTSVSTNTNNFTLTGLNNSSNYQVRVHSLCSANDTSLASIVIPFNTACDIITTFPWIEGFESSWIAPQDLGYALSPNCWTNVNKGSTNPWWTDYMWESSSSAHTGNGSAACYTNGSQGNNDWLITPKMYLTGNQRLRFWAMNYSTTTYQLEEISIWISDENSNIDISNMGIFDSIPGFTKIYQTGISLGDWQQYEFNLNQYTGNRYIAFVRRNAPNSGWYLRLDDVEVSNIPSCARPTNVVSVNNTQNDIEIGWNNGNVSDASWYVYYRPIGTSNYDSVLANSNTYMLTGLLPSTTYNIYVKTNCSTELSEASNVVNLATECGYISSFPWFEGFESNWGPAIAGDRPAPNCWTVIDKGVFGYDYHWTQNTDVSYVHTGIGSAKCYTNYGMSGHNDWLITPQVALTGNERLSFWSMRADNTSTEPDEISVFISNENTVLDTIGMGQYGNMANFTQIFTQILPIGDWQKYEINLNQYSGNRYIAFVRQNTPDGNTLRLDDILIDTLPTCARPTAVTTINGIGTNVDITFTPGHITDASWKIYYKPTTATTWDSINLTSNPTTLSGLALQTNYEIYVKTNCGSGETSEASNTITYTTPCYSSAINTFPYTEGFENGLNCWTVRASGTETNSFWRIQTTGTEPICTPHGGTNMAQFNSSHSPNYAGTWTTMISPALYLTTNMQVSFWIYRDNYSYFTSPLERVSLYIASNQSLSDSILLGEISRSTTVAPIEATEGWYEYTFPIPIGTIGTRYIALKAISNYSYNINVDDVTVDILSVPCPEPTALTVTNTTTTTTNINWIAGASETAWQISLDTISSIIDLTNTSYQFQGLAPGTNYTIYARANCGVNYSSWISQTFTTIAPYQLPTVTTSQQIGTTQTSTTLNGFYVQGTNPILVKGFLWKLANSSTWANQPVSTGTTPFAYTLNGLTENTQYEFRAYVETSQDTTYGATLQFTTLANVIPTVTTTLTTNITQTSATFNGTTAQGTESIQARGFEYKLNSTSTWTGAIDVTASGTNTITANVNGLTPNTQYDVRAYAQTASGRTYGNIETFSTLANTVVLGEVTTQNVSSLLDHSAMLNGNLVSTGNAVENIELGFVYSTITNPVIGGNDVIIDTVTYSAGMTTFSKSISGLLSGTNYYCKAYITNSAGTAYGEEKPFLTAGLNDVNSNKFSISMFPNPATNKTLLVVNGVDGETDIVINDAQGKLIYKTSSKAVNGKIEQTIDVNNFAKGVYYVRIKNQTTSKTQKLIVIN